MKIKNAIFFFNDFLYFKIFNYLCNAKINGTIAQLVEQRTENPCVPGSIPGGTTEKPEAKLRAFCVLYLIFYSKIPEQK